MAYTHTEASEAARELSRARWGTTRVDNLIAGLRERRDELGPPQLAHLRQLLQDHDDERTDHCA
jgi:hypothetical protein